MDGFMTTKTRFKLTLLVLVFLMVTAIAAVFKEMNSVATMAVTGVMTTLTSYIWGETKRPSTTE
jgi:type III secretory pathway component EscU